MNNKPKYSLYFNTKYAIDGLVHALKTETSFKIELLFFLLILLSILICDFTMLEKFMIISTSLLVLIIELVNSAIENVVDLVTTEIKPLAKNAKDIASTAVLFSILLHIIIWILILS